MLELSINGRQIMTLDDSNNTVVYDKNIAKDVESDIEGKKINFELCDKK